MALGSQRMLALVKPQIIRSGTQCASFDSSEDFDEASDIYKVDQKSEKGGRGMRTSAQHVAWMDGRTQYTAQRCVLCPEK